MEGTGSRACARARASRLNPFEIMLVGYRRCCRRDPEAMLNLMNRDAEDALRMPDGS